MAYARRFAPPMKSHHNLFNPSIRHGDSFVLSEMLYPRLEEDVWTFAMELRGERPVEVFELKDPVRIIVDIRTK